MRRFALAVALAGCGPTQLDLMACHDEARENGRLYCQAEECLEQSNGRQYMCRRGGRLERVR